MSADTLTLTVEIREGKLALTDQQARAVDGFLSGRRKPVRFVLSKKTDVRSNQQNALYWSAYVTPIARHLGYSAEDVHEFFRDMFLPRRLITIANREKELRKTTTDLTPSEFSLYLEQISAWTSTELGMLVPENTEPARASKAVAYR